MASVRVHHDETGVRVGSQPLLEGFLESLSEAGKLGCYVEDCGGLAAAEHLAHALLQTPHIVFEGQVEGRAPLDFYLAKGDAAAGSGHAQPQGHPRFAELRLPREQGHALGKDARDGPPRRRELHVHELCGAKERAQGRGFPDRGLRDRPEERLRRFDVLEVSDRGVIGRVAFGRGLDPLKHPRLRGHAPQRVGDAPHVLAALPIIIGPEDHGPTA